MPFWILDTTEVLMFQDKNCGQVFSRSCYWNCSGMWGKEAHVILQCVSCCLLLLPLLNFFTLLPVLTRFSRGVKASELLTFYKYCAISWDRNVCTGSEQMSSKCLHDNGHEKMVRKIIQEQSKWKIYQKYIFQYISPASGYHVMCFLHLIFINRFSLTYLPATGIIWSSLVRYDFLLWKIPPFMKDSSFYWISSTWTNISGIVPGAEIKHHNFKAQRRGTFCVPSSLSLMLLLLCTAPPKRAESPEFEKAVSLHTCSVLLCCFLNDFFSRLFVTISLMGKHMQLNISVQIWLYLLVSG